MGFNPFKDPDCTWGDPPPPFLAAVREKDQTLAEQVRKRHTVA